MRKKNRSSGNLKFATLFSILVGGLIFLSLVLRLFLLVGGSKFDGANSITVQSLQGDSSQIINFSPGNSSISILTLENKITPKQYQIPAEAKFTSSKITAESLSSVLFKKTLDFKDQKELTFMDFFRLSLYSNTVKKTNIVEESISADTEPAVINKIITSFFIDPKIVEEKLNIEIINSTKTPGLGNRLGNLVNNLGGNVILVTTGDVEEKSRVEYLEKSYSAKALGRILKFPVVESRSKGIPDVIIIIGKDSLSDIRF